MNFDDKLSENIYNRNLADMRMQPGRMLYEDDMMEVMSQLKAKISEKVVDFQNKIVIFDIDGTLCEFKYTKKDSTKLLPCRDDQLSEYLKSYDMYDNAEPIRIMQYIIRQCDPESIYTLSTSTEPAKIQKNAWLRKYYPYIKKDHIFYTANDSEKLDVIRKLMLDYPNKQIVFVEDTARTLLNVQEKYPQILVQHTSSFIV
jgi:5'(3')-deoxyribonucleotidase